MPTIERIIQHSAQTEGRKQRGAPDGQTRVMQSMEVVVWGVEGGAWGLIVAWELSGQGWAHHPPREAPDSRPTCPEWSPGKVIWW